MPGRVIIWARVALPGFHAWPDAPPHRGYLAARHRHLFIITAYARVRGDDRETEFHDLADLIRGWWGPPPRDCGPASCEMLARWLAVALDASDIDVERTEVSEDGEAGAIYTPGGPDDDV